MLQSDHFFLSFICQNDISTEMYDGTFNDTFNALSIFDHQA